MIPCIQDRGHSFMGITAYLMHDKDAKTSERVAWTQTGNVRTSDIEKAAKVMAWTDMHREGIRAGYRAEHDMKPSASGRKASAGNVLHHSLSWALGEKPAEEHQRAVVKDYLKHQGLDTHQYYAVGHSDTDHVHVHIVSNLVNPRTGKIHDLSFAKRNAQAWALGYERKHGLHCPMREVHAAQRAQEGAKNYYIDKKTRYGTQITRAYEASDNGKSFINALALEGFTLAKGRKSYVAVGSDGDIVNLSRMIEGHKTTDIKAKLGDLGREKLPGADALAAQRKAEIEQKNQEAEKAAAAKEAKQQDQQPEIRGRDRAEAQGRKAELRKQAPPEPLYKRVDRDRERMREANSKRLVEIDKIRAYYNVGTHRAALEKANKALAAKQGFFARLFGQTRKAEDHACAMRLNLEDAIEKQQQAIDAINRKYHHGPKPEPQAPAPKPEGAGLTRDYEKASTPEQRATGRKPEAPRQQAKPELREDFSRTQTASQPQRPTMPDLGKMRPAAEIEKSVKKQGWQDSGQDDPFSGLKPEFQGRAREAYRQAKAAELKGKKEQESLRQKGPRLDRD